EDRSVACANLLVREYRPFVAETARQGFRRHLLHDVDGLTLRISGGRRAVEFGGGVEVVTRNTRRPRYVVNGRKGTERHSIAVRIADMDFKDVFAVEPELTVRLGRHAECPTKQI